jgi:drug/metabolite transporter (DMT)-like permease
MKARPSRTVAALQALFVTFLWSTSFILVKNGLRDIPPLTFAGLRYAVAAACLAPFALRDRTARGLRAVPFRGWAALALLGLLLYTVTQGAIFVGLERLPAVTVNLALNLTSPLVAGLGILFLGERPTVLQWSGVGLFGLGTLVYFYPPRLAGAQGGALAVVVLGVAANAASVLLGRAINRRGSLHPLAVTAVSMAVGAAVLLAAGAAIQGMPPLEPRLWAIIGWLAVVNTAFAFSLWNHTLRTLSAAESSIINGTMLIQVAILAWLFLNERLSPGQVFGMVLAAAGAVTVQWRGRKGSGTR